MKNNILAGAEQNGGDGGYREVPLSEYKQLCLFCRCEKSYDETFDAFYCAQCNLWLEDTCSDLECDSCRYRPETPNGQSNNK